MRMRPRRAAPITGSGRLPQLGLAMGTRHRDHLYCPTCGTADLWSRSTVACRMLMTYGARDDT
jgi:hypothetical protein